MHRNIDSSQYGSIESNSIESFRHAPIESIHFVSNQFATGACAARRHDSVDFNSIELYIYI